MEVIVIVIVSPGNYTHKKLHPQSLANMTAQMWAE